MVDLYATYDETTASRIVRTHPDKLYSVAAIWDPPASFAGTPRPVYLFEPGGARQARRDLSMGSSEVSPGVHSVPGMMTNELGAFVVCVSTPPGGIDFEAAEEPGQEYSPECRFSAALPTMFLRGNATNPAVVGSVHTMATERRFWTGGGTSAGVWSQLGAQMVPAGDFAELADAESARGDGQFRYHWDHTHGHFSGAIGQNRLSSFCEYVIDPALTGLPSTYVAAGTNNAGAAALGVSGDTAQLKRANRVLVTTASSYVAAGNSIGATVLDVVGGSPPVLAGSYVRYNVGGTDYENLVAADFAGGSGSISIVGDALAVTVPGGTLVKIRTEYAVRTDYAGGAGSVQIWPTLQFPVTAGAAVELVHPSDNQEQYGPWSWAVGYCGTRSMNRPWRSDDSSGRGVPLQEKWDANVDRFLRSNNPRVYELNLMLSGAFGGGLQRVDSLVHERSFWLRRNVAVPTILPEHIGLHDTGDMAHLMHQLYVQRLSRTRNVSGLAGYFGSRRDNPLGTDASVPWLLGRNAAWSAQVLKAFLTDVNRFGGAFA